MLNIVLYDRNTLISARLTVHRNLYRDYNDSEMGAIDAVHHLGKISLPCIRNLTVSVIYRKESISLLNQHATALFDSISETPLLQSLVFQGTVEDPYYPSHSRCDEQLVFFALILGFIHRSCANLYALEMKKLPLDDLEVIQLLQGVSRSRHLVVRTYHSEFTKRMTLKKSAEDADLIPGLKYLSLQFGYSSPMSLSHGLDIPEISAMLQSRVRTLLSCSLTIFQGILFKEDLEALSQPGMVIKEWGSVRLYNRGYAAYSVVFSHPHLYTLSHLSVIAELGKIKLRSWRPFDSEPPQPRIGAMIFSPVRRFLSIIRDIPKLSPVALSYGLITLWGNLRKYPLRVICRVLRQFKRDTRDKSFSLSRIMTKILRSGRPLDSDENQYVDTVLNNLEERLSACKTETVGLETRLSVLKQRNEVLEWKSERFRSLKAPIRRLPTEILSDILLYSLADTGSVTIRRRMLYFKESPLHTLKLCQVCMRWRRVVRSTPQLWATIRMDLAWMTFTEAKASKILRH
ncbi:hypothetical protein VNI00_009218 [Paramarasmius palmivorus]|uniref:F-box domain-containing protein n=1 Tax=Paramarasmius palmivorus TaxID=297713 RepID=A0AAW0CSB7_9AGAR